MSTRLIAAALLALGLSACAAPETATRNAPLDVAGLAPGAVQVQQAYNIVRFDVDVPGDLQASEANRYYPIADIVWRGDAPGDRHEQVASLFQAAGERASSSFQGPNDVVVQVQLVRFHGVTEKTRLSVGGTYNMVFMLQVVDARTGAILEPARQVVANLEAPGGARGRALIEAGQTERVRVVDHLTSVLMSELGANPGV
ncbi:MAG: hypothetical protein P8N72_00255 [Flavimaricola sp.]|nr:hypothetical protein [Flavimaricola sp.]